MKNPNRSIRPLRAGISLFLALSLVAPTLPAASEPPRLASPSSRVFSAIGQQALVAYLGNFTGPDNPLNHGKVQALCTALWTKAIDAYGGLGSDPSADNKAGSADSAPHHDAPVSQAPETPSLTESIARSEERIENFLAEAIEFKRMGRLDAAKAAVHQALTVARISEISHFRTTQRAESLLREIEKWQKPISSIDEKSSYAPFIEEWGTNIRSIEMVETRDATIVFLRERDIPSSLNGNMTCFMFVLEKQSDGRYRVGARARLELTPDGLALVDELYSPIGGKRYMSDGIETLLKKEKIREWRSSQHPSEFAQSMYSRLEQVEGLSVFRDRRGYIVRLSANAGRDNLPSYRGPSPAAPAYSDASRLRALTDYYPEAEDLPSDTPVYRWAATDDGGLAPEGLTFWQTNAPNTAHAQTFLIQTTIGELKESGLIRQDPYEPSQGENLGESLAVIHFPHIVRVPGARSKPIVGWTVHTGSPVFAPEFPWYRRPDSVWQDLEGNRHFPSDELGTPASLLGVIAATRDPESRLGKVVRWFGGGSFSRGVVVASLLGLGLELALAYFGWSYGADGWLGAATAFGLANGLAWAHQPFYRQLQQRGPPSHTRGWVPFALFNAYAAAAVLTAHAFAPAGLLIALVTATAQLWYDVKQIPDLVNGRREIETPETNAPAPKQTERTERIRERMSRPIKKGNQWMRIVARPQEALQFHENWRSDASGDSSVSMDGKTYQLPNAVAEKMMTWMAQSPNFERLGYFIGKENDGLIQINDFVPLGSIAYDSMDDDENTTQSAQAEFEFYGFDEEAAAALDIDWEVQDQLLYAPMTKGDNSFISVPVHSHHVTSHYSMGPSMQDQKRARRIEFVFCLKTGTGHFYSKDDVSTIELHKIDSLSQSPTPETSTNPNTSATSEISDTAHDKGSDDSGNSGADPTAIPRISLKLEKVSAISTLSAIDRAQIQELSTLIWEDSGEETLHASAKWIAKPEGYHVWLLRDTGGRIQGFVSAFIHEDGSWAELEEMAIAPELQKRGYGTQLIQSAMEWLTANSTLMEVAAYDSSQGGSEKILTQKLPTDLRFALDQSDGVGGFYWRRGTSSSAALGSKPTAQPGNSLGQTLQAPTTHGDANVTALASDAAAINQNTDLENARRIEQEGHTLLITPKADEAMKRLDVFAEDRTYTAEIFGFGLTRRHNDTTEVLIDFIVPDFTKVLVSESITAFRMEVVSEAIEGVGELLLESDEVVMKSGQEGFEFTSNDGKKVVVPFWVYPMIEPFVRQAFANLVPEGVEKTREWLEDRGPTAMATGWEFLVYADKVRVGPRYMKRVKEAAEKQNAIPNFTMHHHPRSGMRIRGLEGENIVSREKAFHEMLRPSLGDIGYMIQEGVDWFEIRMLGTPTDMYSDKEVSREFYRVSNINPLIGHLAEAARRLQNPKNDAIGVVVNEVLPWIRKAIALNLTPASLLGYAFYFPKEIQKPNSTDESFRALAILCLFRWSGYDYTDLPELLTKAIFDQATRNSTRLLEPPMTPKEKAFVSSPLLRFPGSDPKTRHGAPLGQTPRTTKVAPLGPRSQARRAPKQDVEDHRGGLSGTPANTPTSATRNLGSDSTKQPDASLGQSPRTNKKSKSLTAEMQIAKEVADTHPLIRNKLELHDSTFLRRFVQTRRILKNNTALGYTETPGTGILLFRDSEFHDERYWRFTQDLLAYLLALVFLIPDTHDILYFVIAHNGALFNSSKPLLSQEHFNGWVRIAKPWFTNAASLADALAAELAHSVNAWLSFRFGSSWVDESQHDLMTKAVNDKLVEVWEFLVTYHLGLREIRDLSDEVRAHIESQGEYASVPDRIHKTAYRPAKLLTKSIRSALPANATQEWLLACAFQLLAIRQLDRSRSNDISEVLQDLEENTFFDAQIMTDFDETSQPGDLWLAVEAWQVYREKFKEALFTHYRRHVILTTQKLDEKDLSKAFEIAVKPVDLFIKNLESCQTIQEARRFGLSAGKLGEDMWPSEIYASFISQIIDREAVLLSNPEQLMVEAVAAIKEHLKKTAEGLAVRERLALRAMLRRLKNVNKEYSRLMLMSS